MSGCTIGFVVWVLSISVLVGIAVFLTKSAAPLWALLILTFFSCKTVKCIKDDTPIYETKDAETGEVFEYVKVKDLK